MYRKEFFDLLKLAAPLVLAQLAQNTASFVDALMVARLGNESLAAITLGSTIFHLANIVLCGVMLAVSPMVSQAMGSGDQETANQSLCQSMWLGIVLFLPAFILYWNAYPLLIWLGQSEATAEASSGYLRAISWGALPSIWLMGLRGFLEGNSNTRPIMVISFGGVLLNIVLNYLLMFGKFGFPELGLVGTGYATSIVYLTTFAAAFAYVRFRYQDHNVYRGLLQFNWQRICELLRIGIPIGFTLGFEMSMFSAAAIAMGTLGENQLAAHHIALQTASISFMVPLGLGIAASVRVGRAIGQENPVAAKVAGHVGMLSCVGVMCVSGLVFWLFPRLIIGMYIDPAAPANAEVVAFATSFLGIAAVFQVVDGLQVGANGSLRGLKDTTVAMVLTFLSYCIIGMLAGYLLCFVAEMGGVGLWWGMTFGLAAASIALSVRFCWQVGTLVQRQDALRN